MKLIVSETDCSTTTMPQIWSKSGIDICKKELSQTEQLLLFFEIRGHLNYCRVTVGDHFFSSKTGLSKNFEKLGVV